ncbi:sensor histidine kinase [Thalassotalea sediminis]|uniref:sensor histidine kinase n=1 Tax=Thalassotalea sediminis TaxID=1759089 RepID=UPI00257425BE|nr:ATP-binding protein [Thalassotalea sediminis]
MQHYTVGWKSMGFKKFSLRIVLRTVLAMVTLGALSLSLSNEGYHATSILLLMIVIIQLTELLRFVNKTNEELVRFFEAARHADYSQRFDLQTLGTGFDELRQSFGDILNQLQSSRQAQETTLKHIKAIVEHVPVPLMSIQSNDSITLWNNSARRLFGANQVTKLSDLTVFSNVFPQQIMAMSAGSRSLVEIKIDGIHHKLSVSATELVIHGDKELLISLLDIQSELNTAQLDAWQDLVRVLTHEIMNSITPVASLAQTAAELVDDLANQQPLDQSLQETITDIADAVHTVARRSDSLTNFVSSYRRLTRLPKPKRTKVALSPLFNDLAQLHQQQWQKRNITFNINTSPQSLTVYADRDMLMQVMENLLLNAQHALANKEDNKVINVSSYLNTRGHVVIEITDNGCGIDEQIAEKIFVPFFTTKREGSGVGLALSRQVMLAHNGHIYLKSEQGKGTTFTLTF